MNRFLRFFSGFLFFVLILVLPVFARNNADAATIAEKFFKAYPNKDFEKMPTFWSEKSPERERFLKQFRFSLTDAENIVFKDFSVKSATAEGDQLTLQISLTMDAWDAKLKRPKWNFGKWNRVLRLVKENDVWKVWQCRFAEEEFAERLANAGDETAQDAFLTENPHLINRFLRRAIVDLTRGLRNRGEYGKVIFLAEMMERLSARTGDEIWLARSLAARGSVFYHVGEQGKAGDLYLKSENLSQKLNDEEGLVLVWQHLGLLRLIQSDDLGNDYYRKSAELAEKIGDIEVLLRVRNNQGAGFFAEAQREVWTHGVNFHTIKLPEKPLREALIYYRQLRDIYEKLGDDLGKAIAIANIGEAFRFLGDFENAREAYAEAVRLSEKIKNYSLRDQIWVTVSFVYMGQNKFREAKDLIEKLLAGGNAESLAGEFSTPQLIAAKVNQKLGDQQTAEKYYLDTIARYENQRKSIANTLTRQRFLRPRVFPYYEMAVLKAEQGNAEEALQFAEKIKGRVLFDVVRSGAKFSEKSLTEEEKTRSEKLKTDIENLNRQIIDERVKSKPDDTKLKEFNEKLTAARAEYEKFQSYLFSVHPEMNLQRGEIPLLSVNEIERLLPDAQTAILEFAVTDEKILVFVMTKAEKLDLRVFKLPVARRDLVPVVRNYWRQITEKNADYKASARELFQMLIEPVAKEFKNRNNLIIIPDGILWELPFQALISAENKFLIENFSISYAPSLSVLAEMSKTKPANLPMNFLAFGNPSLKREAVTRTIDRNRNFRFEPLPEAEREVAVIGAFYGKSQSRIFVGNKAGEDVFKSLAGDFRVLHLATHGVADNENPMFSFLVFSQTADARDDGLLEAWEIMQMKLQADIAVLSACETGRGQIGEGEGLVGLSWAFFVAGVPSTIVSQWNVESGKTADLMVEFYRNLRQKPTKSKALQSAMISMLKNNQTNLPFYWAGFVLVGKN